MKTRAALVACLLSIAIVGCGNKESQVIGKWTGSISLGNSAMASNPMMSGIAKSFSNIPMELKQDHTFTMTFSAMGMNMPMEGNWSMSQDTVTMTTTKMMGQTVEQLKKQIPAQTMSQMQQNGNSMDRPMKLKLSDDGKSLAAIAEGAANTGGASLTFKKS